MIGIFSFHEIYNHTTKTNVTEFEFKFRTGEQWLDPYLTLNSVFFHELKRINLDSLFNLKYIERNTFKNLQNVKDLVLNGHGLKQLLNENDAWLSNLNYYQQPIFWEETYPLDVEEIKTKIFRLIIWFDDKDTWEFNETKDICLFKSFPHEKLVFPFMIANKMKVKCTCTIYWLYKNLSKYELIFNLNEQVMPLHCFEDPNW